MSDQFITAYSREMGHPLEDALESFLIENTEWILSQDAVVEWCIVGKPWAEAVLFVTPPADVHGKSDEKGGPFIGMWPRAFRGKSHFSIIRFNKNWRSYSYFTSCSEKLSACPPHM